jgi:hypothetical protein
VQDVVCADAVLVGEAAMIGSSDGTRSKVTCGRVSGKARVPSPQHRTSLW